MALVTDEYH
jgi:WD40 repeat protein